MQINKRLGKLKIDYEYIYNKPYLITEALYRLRAVPVEIDKAYNKNVLIYTVIPDEFDTVNIGDAIPYYDLFFTCDDDGEVNKISVKRRDEVN